MLTRCSGLQPLQPCVRLGHRCSTIYCQSRRPLKCTISSSLSYKDAGVDIDAGAELVRRIQKLNPSIGGFSGMVPFGRRFSSVCNKPTTDHNQFKSVQSYV